MNYKIKENYSEPVYTLQPSRNVILDANRARKANRVYFIKQRLSGLIMAVLAVIIPFIADGDITASTVILPLGLWLIFTKDKLMVWR